MNDASFMEILALLVAEVVAYMIVSVMLVAPLLMLVIGAIAHANGMEWLPAIGYAPTLGILIAAGLLGLPVRICRAFI